MNKIKYLEARSFLKGYIASQKRIDILSSQLAMRVNMIKTYCTVCGQDSNEPDEAMAATAETIVNLKEELKREEEYSRHVHDALSTIEDPEARLMMEYRYRKGMTIEKIAEKMHYSTKTIKNRHNVGLAAVEAYLAPNHTGSNE